MLRIYRYFRCLLNWRRKGHRILNLLRRDVSLTIINSFFDLYVHILCVRLLKLSLIHNPLKYQFVSLCKWYQPTNPSSQYIKAAAAKWLKDAWKPSINNLIQNTKGGGREIKQEEATREVAEMHKKRRRRVHKRWDKKRGGLTMKWVKGKRKRGPRMS